MIIEPYEAWAPFSEIYGRRRKLQAKSSIASAIGELGVETSHWWRHAPDSVPLVYPNNLIASSTGRVRFRFFLGPLDGKMPDDYLQYAAPEELVNGMRSLESLTFNFGATLFELVEGHLPSNGRKDFPWSRWLRFDTPRGRLFHKMVGNSPLWIGRSPAMRSQPLAQLCDQLIIRHYPAYPQAVLDLADDPIKAVSAASITDYVDQHRREIVDLLLLQQQPLQNWQKPAMSHEQRLYLSMLQAMDFDGKMASERQHVGSITVQAHVEYETLRIDDLMAYLKNLQETFSRFRAFAQVGPADLEIVTFHTGTSFDMDYRFKWRRPPSQNEPADPTALLFAFKKVVADATPQMQTPDMLKVNQKAASKRRKSPLKVREKLSEVAERAAQDGD